MVDYFISDLHFHHENIIHLQSRPFDSVEHMTNSLIARWNNKVTNQDMVYVLGDVSFASKVETKKILLRLNGNKVLIKGNHDKEVPKECFNHIVDYKELRVNDRKLILFHYPIIEYNGYYNNAIHFYGHCHNKVYDIKNAYSVCAEVLGYEPCTFEEVISRNLEWRKNPKCELIKVGV